MAPTSFRSASTAWLTCVPCPRASCPLPSWPCLCQVPTPRPLLPLSFSSPPPAPYAPVPLQLEAAEDGVGSASTEFGKLLAQSVLEQTSARVAQVRSRDAASLCHARYCLPGVHPSSCVEQDLEAIGQAQEKEYQRVAGIKQERLLVADRVLAKEKSIIADCNSVRGCCCQCAPRPAVLV